MVVGALAARHPFILVADFHEDRHYGTANATGKACRNSTAPRLGVRGCDSPPALIASLVADMIAFTPPNSTLLFAGDWLRHDAPPGDAVRDFTSVAQTLSKVTSRGTAAPQLPATSAAPVSTAAPAAGLLRGITALGNNDFNPRQYLDVSASRQPLAEAYGEALVANGLLARQEAALFGSGGGYYYRDLLSPRIRVIVLNTLLYSYYIDPPVNPLHNPDPLGQFAFLAARLGEARKLGLAVVLLGHMAPTMDGYGCVMSPPSSSVVAGSSVSGGGSDGGGVADTTAPAGGSGGVGSGESCQGFMQEEFFDRYSAIVAQFADIIVYQFYGHSHSFTLLADSEMGVPGLVLPGVSPLYGNAPSYLTAEYDDELRTFSNFRLRYLRSPTEGASSGGSSGGSGSGSTTAQWETFSVNRNEYIESMIGPIGTIRDVDLTARRLWAADEPWGIYAVLLSGGGGANMWEGAEGSPRAQQKRFICSMLYFDPYDYFHCVATLGVEEAAGARAVSAGVIAVCVLSLAIGASGLVYAAVQFRRMGEVGVPRYYSPLADGMSSGGGFGGAGGALRRAAEFVGSYRDDVELKAH